MKLAVLLLIIYPCALFASGIEGHEASIGDLLWPVISFSVVFTLLGIKLYKIMIKYFKARFETVEKEYESAQKSIKIANKSFEEINQKMKEIEVEKNKIETSFLNAVKEFEKKTVEDIDEQMIRIKKETTAMIEYEKNKLELELKKELVDSVMVLAKEKIADDKKKNDLVSTNILNQI